MQRKVDSRSSNRVNSSAVSFFFRLNYMTVKCYGSWTLQAARKKINKKKFSKISFDRPN